MWKSLFCVGLLVAGVRSAIGFALLGPINEPYQVQANGFSLPYDLASHARIQMPELSALILYDSNPIHCFAAHAVAQPGGARDAAR